MTTCDIFISVPPSYSEAADPNEQSKLTQGGNQENHDKQAVGQYVDTQYQQPPVPQHEGYQFQPPTEPQHPGYHFQPSSGPQDPGYKYQTPPIGAQFPSCQYQPISGNAGQQPMTVVVTNLYWYYFLSNKLCSQNFLSDHPKNSRHS